MFWSLTSLESCLSDFGIVIPQFLVIFLIMIINILFDYFACF